MCACDRSRGFMCRTHAQQLVVEAIKEMREKESQKATPPDPNDYIARIRAGTD